MKLPDTSYRAVALIAIALSVIGLVMSPVSATAAFSPSGEPEGGGTFTGNAAGHHFMNSTQQTERLTNVIANLSSQGVDVSQAQADLAAGNTEAATQWLMAYHKDHPDPALNGPRQQHSMNATAQAAHIQTIITKLSQDGVDVSKAVADLAAGNPAAAMKDLMALHQARPKMAANSTQQTARLQAGVTRLAQQGVDVSEVQADLTSGNLDAALKWMTAYPAAHPLLAGNTTSPHGSNSTFWQKEGSGRQFTRGTGNQTAIHHGSAWKGQST
jgi:hypothetical protein